MGRHRQPNEMGHPGICPLMIQPSRRMAVRCPGRKYYPLKDQIMGGTPFFPACRGARAALN